MAPPKSQLNPLLLALVKDRTEQKAFIDGFDRRFRAEFRFIGGDKALAFYAKAALKILKTFPLEQVLSPAAKGSRDFGKILVERSAIKRVLNRYKNYLIELVPEWASGGQYLYYSEAFVEPFATALEASLKDIKGLISTTDLQKLERSITKAAEGAPTFLPVKGRLRLRTIDPKRSIKERKSIVRNRCKHLKGLADRRVNQHPDIKRVIDQYDDALSSLRNSRGAYRLLMAGIDIENLLRVKNSLPVNDDSNPQIDAELLNAIQSLIVAHAGLVMSFPDAVNATKELDRYRQQSETIDALRDRVLDPFLERLASTPHIFDLDTEQMTKLVVGVGDQEKAAGLSPSSGVVAIKHSWLRGFLASVARLVLDKSAEFAKAARDGVIGNAAFEALKQPETLVVAITGLLIAGRSAILQLAETLPAAFGWLRQLFHMMGL